MLLHALSSSPSPTNHKLTVMSSLLFFFFLIDIIGTKVDFFFFWANKSSSSSLGPFLHSSLVVHLSSSWCSTFATSVALWSLPPTFFGVQSLWWCSLTLRCLSTRLNQLPASLHGELTFGRNLEELQTYSNQLFWAGRERNVTCLTVYLSRLVKLCISSWLSIKLSWLNLISVCQVSLCSNSTIEP